MSVEPGRFERGYRLPVYRLGPAQFAVAGSHGPRYVDLTQEPPCLCEDMEYRNAAGTGYCKHTISALLQQHDPAMVELLAERLMRRQRHMEEL